MLEGLDLATVGPWLEANVDGAVGPFEASLIGGGRSNLTFTVVGSDGTKFVLRRPPLGHVLATAHDMAREFKIIAAVGKTDVPVPPALGLCTDVEVNGAPFYVMGHVDGVVLDSPEKAAQLDPALRQKASDDLIDVLADLHAVDIDAVGLGDLARREGYIERQVKRWSTQWANSKTRELPAIDEVAQRLGERLPVQQGAVIAHGDYRFGNCLTDPDGRAHRRRPRLGAVHARRPARRRRLPARVLGEPGRGGPAQRPDERRRLPVLRGPARALRRRAPGRDVSGVDYYVAFSSWRLAVISEGVYSRYLHGAMGDQGLEPGRPRRHEAGHRAPRRERPRRRPPPGLTAPRSHPSVRSHAECFVRVGPAARHSDAATHSDGRGRHS